MLDRLPYPPPIPLQLTERGSTIRGRVKEQVEAAFQRSYGFKNGASDDIIEYNKTKYLELRTDYSYNDKVLLAPLSISLLTAASAGSFSRDEALSERHRHGHRHRLPLQKYKKFRGYECYTRSLQSHPPCFHCPYLPHRAPCY